MRVNIRRYSFDPTRFDVHRRLLIESSFTIIKFFQHEEKKPKKNQYFINENMLIYEILENTIWIKGRCVVHCDDTWSFLGYSKINM